MSRNKYWLCAAALAASSVQASAFVPQTTSLPERPVPPVVAGATGLIAADLIVGLDGTVAFDAKACGVKVADDNDSANRHCGYNTNNGC